MRTNPSPTALELKKENRLLKLALVDTRARILANVGRYGWGELALDNIDKVLGR